MADSKPTSVIDVIALCLVTGNALRHLTALRAVGGQQRDQRVACTCIAHRKRIAAQRRQLHVYQRNFLHRAKRTVTGLTGLPLLAGLTDLRLQMERGEDQSPLVASRFAALQRLHLSSAIDSVLHATLCCPQLQRLQTLTLEYVHTPRAAANADAGGAGARLDWSLCFTNLHSLHTLSLKAVEVTNPLLTAIHSARPPSLRWIRFHQYLTIGDKVADTILLTPLLAQLPGLTVELLMSHFQPDHTDPECSNLLSQWAALRSEWEELGRRPPAHAVVTELILDDECNPFDSWDH